MTSSGDSEVSSLRDLALRKVFQGRVLKWRSRVGSARIEQDLTTSEKDVQMREVGEQDLKDFIETNKEITIGTKKIRIGQPKKIKQFQPEEFRLERTNAWSFPKRGDWATHKGDFRGNWPPQMARNII